MNVLRSSFFAPSLAVISLLTLAVIACSSSEADNGGTPPTGTDGGGVDEAGGNGDGGEGGIPFDAGPKPFGSVPPSTPTTYTCVKDLNVATTGDDTTGDGSAALPYKTIVKAALLAVAGDCVKVHAGTYAEGTSILFSGDGTVDQPIVLLSADGPRMAIIDGMTNRTGPTVDVKNDYIVIDGFEFKNTPIDTAFHTVRFDGNYAGKCVGSVLRNSKLTGGANALKIFQKTQGVLVENNEFYGKSAGSPLSLTGASGLIFRANYCHDWNSVDNGSVLLAGGSTDVLLENNLFQDVASFAGTIALGDGCGTTCDNDPEHFGAVNARAINNVFIRSFRPFDILGCKNCSVLSNTIIDSGQTFVFKLGSADTNGTTRATIGLRIINNLVTSPSGVMAYVIRIDDAAGSGLQMDYNLFSNGPHPVAFGEQHPVNADTHSVQKAPNLVSAMDFRPAVGSPAIGAGTNLVGEVAKDFLGAARPASGPFDIGAYQH